MYLKDPFAPVSKGSMLSRRIPSILILHSLLFFVAFLYTNTMSFLHFLFSLSFSLLCNLFIHSALNLFFFCPLSFHLLWFRFLLPLFQGWYQGLGLYFSSTREQDDTVIYSFTSCSAGPWSSHGPCHQTLSTSSRSFCVSGAPCSSFFSQGVWISHLMFCRVIPLYHRAHNLSPSAGSATFIVILDPN